MRYEEIIQRRVARELHPGTLVNLGIGLPTGVSQFILPEDGILFQSENGIVGMGARPPEGMEYSELTDAGGSFVTACRARRPSTAPLLRPHPRRPSRRDRARRA